jgi:polyphosphate kinase 2 (PPK2 family)
LAKSKTKGVAQQPSDDDVAGPQKLTRKEFEEELYKLQVELTRLQTWAVAEGARAVVVFEGRDTAVKGGVISRIMQRCSPRVFEATDTPVAPWYVVPADDKRRARLNLISHLLSRIPYKKVAVDLPEIPRSAPRPKGVEHGLRAGQVVPHHY